MSTEIESATGFSTSLNIFKRQLEASFFFNTHTHTRVCADSLVLKDPQNQTGGHIVFLGRKCFLNNASGRKKER
jgi:hypothetical protein